MGIGNVINSKHNTPYVYTQFTRGYCDSNLCENRKILQTRRVLCVLS